MVVAVCLHGAHTHCRRPGPTRLLENCNWWKNLNAKRREQKLEAGICIYLELLPERTSRRNPLPRILSKFPSIFVISRPDTMVYFAPFAPFIILVLLVNDVVANLLTLTPFVSRHGHGHRDGRGRTAATCQLDSSNPLIKTPLKLFCTTNPPLTKMTSTTAVPALIRTAARAVLAKEQAEGVGARVRRSIGTHSLRNFDPFLMLDEFHVAPPAGFSDHPHRGFETVTYMLKGEFEHEDFAGHRGRIAAGDLQWMTAGRGIVHAEVPVADENAGLQLWVNLPGKDKMMEPRYQELRGAELPTVTPADGVSIKLIAGEAFGASAKVHTLTPICYFDVTMGADAKVNLPVPSGFNVFLYILEGSLSVGGNLLAARQHECVVLDPVTPGNDNPKSEVPIVASPSGSRFVFIGGEPIGEQIYQHGPFVMNSAEEIRQAMVDYHAGKNGFERAPEFRSEISSRVARW